MTGCDTVCAVYGLTPLDVAMPESWQPIAFMVRGCPKLFDGHYDEAGGHFHGWHSRGHVTADVPPGDVVGWRTRAEVAA